MAWQNGRVQIAATGVAQRVSTKDIKYTQIQFQPDNANTASVYLGGQTVTTAEGYELLTGERQFFPNISNLTLLNLRDLWIIGTQGDALRWLAFK
jgi:hypothetical protein